MSGEVIWFDEAKRKLEEDNQGSESDHPSTRDLAEEAKALFNKETPTRRNILVARVRACAIAAYDSRRRIGSGLRKGIQSLSRPHDPIDVNGILFRDEGELEAFLGSEEDFRREVGDERADSVISLIERQQLDGIAPEGIKKELAIINEARRNGVPSSRIITPEDIRRALATRDVYDGMARVVPGARIQISGILTSLRVASQEGVKAKPLGKAIQGIAKTCRKMTQEMDQLKRKAHRLASGSEDCEAKEACKRIDRLAKEARAIFRPFTSEAYVVTMEQVDQLFVFLAHVQSALDESDRWLTPGIRQIEYHNAIGQHLDAERIEASLMTDQVYTGFRENARALRKAIGVHYHIIAAAGLKSAATLKNVPHEALVEAGVAHRLNEHNGEELVLPPHDDLESR